jgi:hypothetical protein
MRKLWLRLYLWWNDICPKHGPEMGGGFPDYHYCIECNYSKQVSHQEEQERNLREYQQLVEPTKK